MALWDEVARERARIAADLREQAVRARLRDNLPRPLHWTIDSPRVLRVVLWLKPSWKPRIYSSPNGSWLGNEESHRGR